MGMSKNTILLSVIIPCFNCEKYIDKCIESLQPELHPELQILLIDDGSTDSTAEKCRNAAEANANIQAVHTENRGVSHARNVGLAHAQGEWIAFLDSDDTMDPQYFDVFLRNCADTDAELVRFGVTCIYYDNNGQVLKRERRTMKSFAQDAIQCKDCHISREFDTLFQENVFDSAWGGFYRRDVIRKQGIHFDETMTVREDSVFVLDYAKHVTSVRMINQYLYNYRIAGSELYHYRRTVPVEDIKKLYDRYFEFLKAKGMDYGHVDQMLAHHIFQQLIGGIIHYSAKRYGEPFANLYAYMKRMGVVFAPLWKEVAYGSLFFKALIFMMKKKMFAGAAMMCKMRYNNLYRRSI